MVVEAGNPSMSQNSLLNMGVRAFDAKMVVRPWFGNVVLAPSHWLIVKEVEPLYLDVEWTEARRKMVNAQIRWRDM